MGKNRPIVVATLGYIIGIIWGLYFKMNIALFYALIGIILMLAKCFRRFINKKQTQRKFKFISIQKIFRYIKLILNFKSLIIIIIFSSISNLIVINQENKYENLYSGLEEVNIVAKIVDNGKDKEYKTTFKIKVEHVNGKKEYKNTYLYLDVKNALNVDLKYGDCINLYCKYKEPSQATNYGGFDYSKYLKTLKIYGTVEPKQIYILKENSNNIFFTISNNVFIKIKEMIQYNIPEEKANLLLGILIGYREEITETMEEDFKKSNISHVLAVSGLHVSYIILVITKILKKVQGKRIAKLTTIVFIFGYMFITNFSPSVVRAGLMGIISMVSYLTYNKNDIWTAIAISILCILIYNPYLITSAGVLLSYGGTIGIILFQKNITLILEKLKSKSKTYKYKAKRKLTKVVDYIQDTISVSFSAQLVIAPIMAKMFNTTSLSFFITNFFVSLIIGPIIISGFLFVILNFLFSQIISNSIINIFLIIIKFIVEKLLEALIFISKLGKFIPFSQIYIATPKMWQIATYYLVVFIINVFCKISMKRKITAFEKRLINWKNLIKHLIRKSYKKVTAIIICIAILACLINIIPKDLKIYFIDVGQGDTTLIVTPQEKTILIDGGGSENYDVGKNTLLPYLLDRKIMKIDCIIISHFDTDHVGGLILLLQELKVGQVIIGRQYEDSKNLQEFLKIIEDKKIPINVVEAGNRINIEKNLYFDVLWPSSRELISENSLNNNSLICKFNYKNFSILFTGDIEEIAEKQIISIYGKSNILNSTVLKVAHHGSKTSSTKEFLELVQPKLALIGVGKNNIYGHPNSDVLNRLKESRCKNL